MPLNEPTLTPPSDPVATLECILKRAKRANQTSPEYLAAALAGASPAPLPATTALDVHQLNKPPSRRLLQRMLDGGNMHNFDFDRHFKQTRRFAFVAVIFNALLGLGLLGLVIWVAAHFLKRYW